ncbi:MAG: cyanophycinase, partial [Proteobacteria bacterium]|nr:cyanophycinase [Pseudomonadota bacterium]
MCPATAVENIDRGWIIPIGGAEDKENDMTILRKFWKLSGGEDAKILVIPTASQLEDTGPRYVDLFEGLGGKALYISVDER